VARGPADRSASSGAIGGRIGGERQGQRLLTRPGGGVNPHLVVDDESNYL
jgi:hypothetical protein